MDRDRLKNILPTNPFMAGLVTHEFSRLCRTALNHRDLMESRWVEMDRRHLTRFYDPEIGLNRILSLWPIGSSQLRAVLPKTILSTALYYLGRFAHVLLACLGVPYFPYLNVAYYIDCYYRNRFYVNRTAEKDRLILEIDRQERDVAIPKLEQKEKAASKK